VKRNTILVRKPFGRLRKRWEIIIKMDVKEK
jgi:hypothetical protein